ncbi:hypothetical protein [Paracoccus sanguinis]|uniref:Uncharacterized protein n=1 Tax=Paracoccus sanguinis TaxID=1545044 RepID=A0A099GMG1_9RHOB|nr:hypothetical protein [Paracoccus sanguinis]KGJ23732.1 hypothetical protein IX56_00160 [Paracoccus sanguinis]
MSNDYIIGSVIPIQTRNGNQGTLALEDIPHLPVGAKFTVNALDDEIPWLIPGTALDVLPIEDDSVFGDDDHVSNQQDAYDGPFYGGKASDMIADLCRDLADLSKLGRRGHFTRERMATWFVHYWVAGGQVFGDRELPGWIDPSEAIAVSLAPIADLPAGAVSEEDIARVIAEPIRQAVLKLGGADVYAEMLDERRLMNGLKGVPEFVPYYQGETGALIFPVCDDIEHWLDTGRHTLDEVASWWVHYWVHEDQVVGDYQLPRGVDPSSVISVSLEPIREIPPQHIDGHWIARAIGQSIREAVMRLGAPDLEPDYLDAIGQGRP